MSSSFVLASGTGQYSQPTLELLRSASAHASPQKPSAAAGARPLAAVAARDPRLAVGGADHRDAALAAALAGAAEDALQVRIAGAVADRLEAAAHAVGGALVVRVAVARAGAGRAPSRTAVGAGRHGGVDARAAAVARRRRVARAARGEEKAEQGDAYGHRRQPTPPRARRQRPGPTRRAYAGLSRAPRARPPSAS